MQKAIVIVNPSCHQGKGWKRWLSIRNDVQQRLPANFTEVVLEKGIELKETLRPHWQQGDTTILISAGGDGSVHYLVNHLLNEEKEKVRHVTLGAIGLGSSNDFLKPFDDKIKGVPVRINRKGGTMLHDAGIARFVDETNVAQKKFFIVNASAGVTAEANWSFNHPGALLRFLKKKATGAAIVYTAVSTILRYRNTMLYLTFNEKVLHAPISNINVLKVPFVSGSFFYRQGIRRDDGKLGLNICLDMSKRELLSVLTGLQKGNFPKSSKTLEAFTTDIHISADHPFVFECDGETDKANELHVTILPKAISVLKK